MHSSQPKNALIAVTIIIAILGGLVPLDKLTELVNMGTLLAFMFVSLGVLPLRKRTDMKHDGYKMPGYPVLPILSALFSFFLITQLQKATLITAAIWFILGIILYLTYGVKHSKLNDK
jgi:APA family basic amino acid/polyamine antiporter